jgi:hypothetical protein
MGLARTLPPAELDGPRLAAEIAGLRQFRPQPFELDLGGGAASTRILERLVRDRARRVRTVAACA